MEYISVIIYFIFYMFIQHYYVHSVKYYKQKWVTPGEKDTKNCEKLKSAKQQEMLEP